MTTAPVDPRLAMESVSSQDLVQKKLAIDAMKKRVNAGPSEDARLREACEGFESIFLQKMWEQMRKNVKKEGYLHSKDEEAYQAMFDVELARKMASAGGIGLGDMLYQQLSQKLSTSSKSTGLPAMRAPLAIEPARPPKVEPQAETGAPGDLYTDADDAPVAAPPVNNPITDALAALSEGMDPSLDPANATYPMFDLQTGTPLNPVAGRIKQESQPARDVSLTPLPERVSSPARPKPTNTTRMNRSGRNSRRNAQARNTQARNTQAAQQRRVQPQGAEAAPVTAGQVQGNWPVKGDVVSSYGRQVGIDGTAAWNTGLEFAVLPDSPVTAPMDGVVAFAGEKDGLPQVVLEHEGGLTSHYFNALAMAAEGQTVAAGTPFATVGVREERDAADEAVRLGFEIRRGELALNPARFLA